MAPSTPLYQTVYDDLRHRIAAGEFAIGEKLPSISALQEHYNVAALNTIRQAQQMLVVDGLIETKQGVGAIVRRTTASPRAIDVLSELRSARVALDRAILALEHAAARPRSADIVGREGEDGPHDDVDA